MKSILDLIISLLLIAGIGYCVISSLQEPARTGHFVFIIFPSILGMSIVCQAFADYWNDRKVREMDARLKVELAKIRQRRRK